MALTSNPNYGDKCVDEFGNVCVYNGLAWICNDPIQTSSGRFDFETLTLIIGASGQTAFPLGTTITNPYKTQVFVNGIKMEYGVQYNFDGTNSVLNWINPNYILKTIYSLELLY